MVEITLTQGTDEISFNPILINSVNLGRALLGSSTRAIDGTLLTYVAGKKKEIAISATCEVVDALQIQEWEEEGSTVAFEMEDHAGEELADYNCVLTDVGVDYSQTEGMASVSFTAREI